MIKMFLCTEDLYMQHGPLAFKKGKIYEGEQEKLFGNGSFYRFDSEFGMNHYVNMDVNIAGTMGKSFTEVKKTLTFVKNET